MFLRLSLQKTLKQKNSFDLVELVQFSLGLFLTELGFIANFYYFIDSYNWLADRLLYDPQKKVFTHRKDNLVKLIMWVAIILVLVSTILLAWMRVKSFLCFVACLCFISICYFGSRVIENCLVIFHIQLNNWKRFYQIVTAGLAYYIYFVLILLVYCVTYYFLIELYRRVENDLGGHKYFIDLPDNRFAHKY